MRAAEAQFQKEEEDIYDSLGGRGFLSAHTNAEWKQWEKARVRWENVVKEQIAYCNRRGASLSTFGHEFDDAERATGEEEALLQGRALGLPDGVMGVAVRVLAHRVLGAGFSSEGGVDERGRIIADLAESIDVPV